MPEIFVEELVEAPVEKIYRIAQEIERFPEWMPNVKSVTILSRRGETVTGRWVARVEEFKRTIRWIQEDVWDDAQHKCTFRATEGDWDRYEGVWDFLPEEEKTRLQLRVNFEFNVPLIGPLVRGLLAKLVEKNSREMMQALARQAKESN